MGVEILLPVLLLVVLDVAAMIWGVDSRNWGLDPKSEGRPYRWI